MRDSEASTFNWDTFDKTKRKRNGTSESVDRSDTQNNRKVSPVTQKIEADDTVRSDCTVPVHQNGFITINNFVMAVGKNIPHNIVVEVTCSAGYFMDLNRRSDNRIKCKDGSWNKKFPLCEGLSYFSTHI